jgi:hypothetical protein
MHASSDKRFCLPARIRTRLVPEPVPQADRELASRLAGLPRAQTTEDQHLAHARTLSVFLRQFGSSDGDGQPAILLCRIGSEGISVEGLSDNERHQVLSRGWGSLEKRRVRLFPPRDDEELEVCWSILCRAYHSILSTPVDSPTAPRVSVADLPEVSRTSLC